MPEYQEIPDHKEAKAVMKGYVEEVIEKVEKSPSSSELQTGEAIKKTKLIINDPKFINQKGIRSMVDEDARVGRKSKTQSFYGYKTEFVMTTDERIITSVRTADGSYMDGNYAKDMLEDTKKSGMRLEEVYGDKAYFRKSILDVVEEMKAKPYIPVSSLVYRIDESKYSYNKDSDEWQCNQGNTTVKKKHYVSNRKDGKREGYKYYFELNQCKACPLHDECTQKRARRILTVGKNTTEFYDISQYQKTDEFKEKYKKERLLKGKTLNSRGFMAYLVYGDMVY